MKTFAEQVAALKATREKKLEDLKAVAQKSVDESRSMDNAEQEAFDTLQEEIDRIDGDIKRLSLLSEMDKKSVEPVQNQKANAPAYRGLEVEIKRSEKVEPGIGLARFARVKALAVLTNNTPLDIARSLYPNHGELHDVIHKGAVGAANTDQTDVGISPTWAGDLVLDGGAFFADFVEYLRPRTIMGQIQDRLRRIPFNTNVLIQSSAGNAKWVAEGLPKPLTKWTYSRAKLEPLKVASIAAVTKETLRQSSIAADTLIRDELVRCIASAIDAKFLSDDSAVSGTSPAGILKDAVDISLRLGSTVPDVDSIRCDIAMFFKALIKGNLSLDNAFFVMSELTASNLSLMANIAGGEAFPDIGYKGGTLAGVPVITTQYVDDSDTNGQGVVLVKGDEVYFADDGGVEVSVSDQASLQMDNAPTTQTAISGTGTSLVSLWQTNSVGFLVERVLNWSKRRDEAVVYGKVYWDCDKPVTP